MYYLNGNILNYNIPQNIMMQVRSISNISGKTFESILAAAVYNNYVHKIYEHIS